MAEPTPASEPARRGDNPEEGRDFAVALAEMAVQTRCHDLSVLDVRGLSPVTDYLVIGTGTSARQMRSVIDDLVELGEERKRAALSRSGTDGESWMLVDFVNVVVHLFNEEARSFYDLESLWGDARKVEWQPPAKPA